MGVAGNGQAAQRDLAGASKTVARCVEIAALYSDIVGTSRAGKSDLPS
jgi:hypothetical protein